MEHHHLTAIVAAILTAGSLNERTHEIQAVTKYRRLLKYLNETGGPLAEDDLSGQTPTVTVL